MKKLIIINYIKKLDLSEIIDVGDCFNKLNEILIFTTELYLYNTYKYIM